MSYRKLPSIGVPGYPIEKRCVFFFAISNSIKLTRKRGEKGVGMHRLCLEHDPIGCYLKLPSLPNPFEVRQFIIRPEMYADFNALRPRTLLVDTWSFFLFFCLGRTQKSNSEPPENEHMPLKKDGCKMHFPCKHGSFPWEKSFMFRAGVQV